MSDEEVHKAPAPQEASNRPDIRPQNQEESPQEGKERSSPLSSEQDKKKAPQSAAEPQHSTNVDKMNTLKNTRTPASTNVDKIPTVKVPQINLSMFPQDNKKKAAEKPKGPNAEVIKKINDGKLALRNRSKEADLAVGAQDARQSKSFFASKHIKTISEKTSSQYLERSRLLVNRYKKEQNIPAEIDDFDPTEFVLWLLSLKPLVKSSTWRVYRQAAYHMLEGMPSDIEDAIRILDNDIIENDAKAGKRENWDDKVTRGEHKTSSMKEKRFPKKDFDKVLAYLQYASRSKLSPILRDWLIATIHTGLRPIEWRASSVEKFVDEFGRSWIWLYVINAKASNSRGNGVVRTIDISNLPSDILNSIERMSENGVNWFQEGKYDSMQSQVSQLLYSIVEKIFPTKAKHYALYSCRHQFIANMKEIMTPEEVSALSGHAVTKTAIQNYGKKRSSWGPQEISRHAKPVPEEVATVRKTAKFYNERMSNLQKAGLIHGNTDQEYPV